MANRSGATTDVFNNWTLEPVEGNSVEDLAFVRTIVQTLLDKGDIAGALNLMVASRGIVEQAHSQAIDDGILLGPLAIRRLATQIIDILSGSLQHVADACDEDHAAIIDLASQRLQKVFMG